MCTKNKSDVSSESSDTDYHREDKKSHKWEWQGEKNYNIDSLM